MGAFNWLWDASKWVKALADTDGRLEVFLTGQKQSDVSHIPVLLDDLGQVLVSGQGVEKVVSEIESVTAAAAMTIQPGEGDAWKITSIYWNKAVTVAFTDGTNVSSQPAETGAGGWFNLTMYLTHVHYMTITNDDPAANAIIGYNGVKVT